jgi:hypothetical protein
MTKIKDSAGLFGMKVVPLPEYEAIVNHDFTPGCEDAPILFPVVRERSMAFGLFRKRLPEPAAPAIRVNGRHWGGFRTAYKL